MSGELATHVANLQRENERLKSDLEQAEQKIAFTTETLTSTVNLANERVKQAENDRDRVGNDARVVIRDALILREQAERRETRVRHILENIADPYNERAGKLHQWADEALAIIKEKP